MDPTMIILLVTQCITLALNVFTSIKHSKCHSCCTDMELDMQPLKSNASQPQ